ncbi:hypothetical protein HJFPF1_00704 [Paramyrothecium foliicola]|nr:hypothetical protein HJFPF1_00704 [Paramyrothecium foliicola]
MDAYKTTRIRSFQRNRGLIAVAVAAATAALVGFRARSNALRNNDLAQRNSNPTGYVSVDRSGGGV